MRKSIAHQIIVSLHRLYIPKINEELHNNLAKILPEISKMETTSTKLDNQDIVNILNAQPNVKINVAPKLPKDRPYVPDSQKAVDAKAQLLEKMREAQKKNKPANEK
jgi:hypothetical protein